MRQDVSSDTWSEYCEMEQRRYELRQMLRFGRRWRLMRQDTETWAAYCAMEQGEIVPLPPMAMAA